MEKNYSLFSMFHTIIKNEFKKVWKKIDKDDVLSDINQVALDIFKIALNDDNNIKFLSPKSLNKMYIVPKNYLLNADISIFVIFEYSYSRDSNLIIVNHRYKYTFDIPQKTSEMMKEMFENKVEDDRKTMETNIMNNINSSLLIVLSEFKNNLEK